MTLYREHNIRECIVLIFIPLVQELSIKSNQHSLHEQKYKWKGIARKKILNAMK
jgi:hypothetical protein